VHKVWDDCSFTRNDCNAGLSRALLQTFHNVGYKPWPWLLEGQVVNHCKRFGTDAYDVVHVHSNAVDTNRVVLAACFRNKNFRPNTVSVQSQRVVFANFDKAGIVSTNAEDLSQPSFPVLKGSGQNRFNALVNF
jgi:hypothetical protein